MASFRSSWTFLKKNSATERKRKMSLHRGRPPIPFDHPSVPSPERAEERAILSTRGRIDAQPGVDEPDRRATHRMSLLWLAPYYCGTEQEWVRDQPQARSATDVHSWIACDRSVSCNFQERFRASKVPLSAQGSRCCSAATSGQLRYHLHQVAKWVRLSCCSHRLVLQNDLSVEAFQLVGGGLLYRSIRRVSRMGNPEILVVQH